MDAFGALHKTKVNGWQLKPYFSQVLKEQVDSAQVSLDINKPLGLGAQDPSLAQHIPYISSMNIGPITHPCIDTFLCDACTTIDHFPIGRGDECTSTMQGSDDIKEDQEQEA